MEEILTTILHHFPIHLVSAHEADQLREVWCLASIPSHVWSVVGYQGCFVEEVRLYVQMEFCVSGGSLEQFVRRWWGCGDLLHCIVLSIHPVSHQIHT